jgi:hypothetical protein
VKTVLIVLFTAALATAQNPATAYYPDSVVPENALGVAVNSVKLKLDQAITAAATSALVDDATAVRTGGYLKLENEYVLVCGKSGRTLQFGRSSCPNVDGRGVDGSTAAAHSRYKVLEGFVPAGGWNQLAAEVRSLEENAGTGSGTPGGTDSAVQVNEAGEFGADPANFAYVKTPLATPGMPSVAVHGAAGSTTYSYAVAFRSKVGVTLASSNSTVTGGNASLNGTNYNIITPPACPALGDSVDVFRMDGGVTGWIANIACGAALNDTGLTACFYSAYGCGSPTTNTSKGAYVNGALRINGNIAAGDGIPDRDPSTLVGYVDQVGILYYKRAQTTPLPQSNGMIGVESVLHVIPSGNAYGSYFASANEVATTADNTDNVGELAGTSNDVVHRGAGIVSLAVGFDNGVDNRGGAVQRAIGLRGQTHQGGAGSHTNAATGIDAGIDSFGAGSTIDNALSCPT